MEDKVLFGRKQTASLLDISLRTLDHLVQNGQIFPIRIGKRIMFTRLTIDRFIQKDHPTH
jgi:hypothetical protein